MHRRQFPPPSRRLPPAARPRGLDRLKAAVAFLVALLGLAEQGNAVHDGHGHEVYLDHVQVVHLVAQPRLGVIEEILTLTLSVDVEGDLPAPRKHAH